MAETADESADRSFDWAVVGYSTSSELAIQDDL
jgi:hypothetical protein